MARHHRIVYTLDTEPEKEAGVYTPRLPSQAQKPVADVRRSSVPRLMLGGGAGQDPATHCATQGTNTHACGGSGVDAAGESHGFSFLLRTLPRKGGSWPSNESASSKQSPLFKKKKMKT